VDTTTTDEAIQRARSSRARHWPDPSSRRTVVIEHALVAQGGELLELGDRRIHGRSCRRRRGRLLGSRA
jgi:hypothetical protein